MEKLFLTDGFVDFLGHKPVFHHTTPCTEKEILPYTIDQIRMPHSQGYLAEILSTIIPDENTRQTFLYFLSLIPSGISNKYSLLLLGNARTGKSLLCKILLHAFSKTASVLPAETFCYKEKTPLAAYVALDNKNVAILDGLNHERVIDSDTFHHLTASNVISYRRLYSNEERRFSPTAQILMTSCYPVKFSPLAPGIQDRLIVVPLEHCVSFSPNFIHAAMNEAPFLIWHLITRYIHLRDNLHGEIPISYKCLAANKEMFA